jgi:hypothetical protein
MGRAVIGRALLRDWVIICYLWGVFGPFGRLWESGESETRERDEQNLDAIAA